MWADMRKVYYEVAVSALSLEAIPDGVCLAKLIHSTAAFSLD